MNSNIPFIKVEKAASVIKIDAAFFEKRIEYIAHII